MRLRRFTNYLLAHRWQTLAFTFAITFVPVIGGIGILIAALVTLRKSVAEGAILTAAATIPYVTSLFISAEPLTALPLVVWAAVGFAVLSNILTWLFAVMLHRHASWSLILQVGALLGILTVSAVHLAYPNVTEWWVAQLQAFYAQAQASASALQGVAADKANSAEAISYSSQQYATGFMVTAVLFVAVLQLIIARLWSGIVFGGHLRKELQNIRMSRLASALFLVSIVLYYLGNGVILDIMPILYVLFGAAGLSLVHYMFRQSVSPSKWFWLVVLYVALFFLQPTSVVFIAILAVVDAWLDVRKRFNKV